MINIFEEQNLNAKFQGLSIRVPKVPFRFFDKLKNEIQNSILDFGFTLIKKTKFK